MHNHGYSLAAIINKCLSGKTTGLERLRLSHAQLPWGMYYNKHIDYTPKPKKKKADFESSPKEKHAQASKGKRLKTSSKATQSTKEKQPTTKSKAKGDGVDTLLKVPDEQPQKKSGIDEGAGDKLEVPDVPGYNSDSEEESWTFSDSDDDDYVNEELDANDDSDKNESDDEVSFVPRFTIPVVNGWVIIFQAPWAFVSAYTEKIGCAEALRRCSSGVDDSIEEAELINENRNSNNRILEALSTWALAVIIFQRPEELQRYRRRRWGVGALSFLSLIKDGFVQAWTAVRTMEHVAGATEIESTDVLTPKLCAQAALVAQLRRGFANERSRSTQKDEEILLLKAHLVDAARPSRVIEVLCTALARRNGTACQGAAKRRVEGLLEKQEEKLRKLSIEYDEELYPHMLSAIAERRWLISHGLRLAAMSTLESQEVKQSFGDVVKCALARGKAEAVEELHEKKLLTVPAAQVPGYNDKAYEELVAAMEAMKLLELPHIAQLERDQDYPIDVIMAGLTLARHATEGAEGQPDYFLKPDVAQLQVPIFARPRDILNPFALEREIPLKETLEAHAIRHAKKKGVKGKAILCGVGAAHIPRSDGVPVSVATVSPKDSELLGKLEEAGDAAYQVGSSGARRCHSL
ncbi:hypothetical protein Tco_1006042 [Tanacetum coccineum]|uniref:Uncharacterized protein n=1 Tax=Tanacetum coccineum TaxID=301880 RepID=A0ABQ5FHQ3_9ASTR